MKHHGHDARPVNGTQSGWQPAELQRATYDANIHRYADINAAMAAGYRFNSKALAALPDPTKNMFHLKATTAKSDRSVLDPNAPEHMIYRREPNGQFTLVGVMYETGRRDGSPLVGDLGWFHRHVGNKVVPSEPGRGGMMHVWFSRGLADAYSPHAPAEIKNGGKPTISPQARSVGSPVAAGHAQLAMDPAAYYAPAAAAGQSAWHAPPYAVAPTGQSAWHDTVLGWFSNLLAPLFG